MIKAIDRFMAGKHNAHCALFVILFVSFGRHLLDTAKNPALSASLHQGVYGLSVGIFFYTILYFLLSALLTILLKRSYERVANAAVVGILFGLVPPLLDLLLGDHRYPDYLYTFSFSMSSAKQSIGETLTCWAAMLFAGVFVYIITRSFWRALAGFTGVYFILQLVGSLIIIIFFRLTGAPSKSMVPFHWNNATYVVLSWVIYILLRGRPMLTSLKRTNHALPFVLILFCGHAWAGFDLSMEVVFRAAILFTLFYTLLIHNDYYDRKEDKLANRLDATCADDVVWSTFLLSQCILLALGQKYVIFSMLIVFGLMAGFFYHHPSMRIKERFCLSYKIEGVWTLTAFLCGSFGALEYTNEIPLLVPAILVFFGGTLISMPKDYKDLRSDLEARIPTYYVVLVRRGVTEFAAHRRIVLFVTLGLLSPALALIALNGFKIPLILYFLSCFAPGLVLLLIRNPKRAVELMMWMVSLNLFFLWIALSHGYARYQ